MNALLSSSSILNRLRIQIKTAANKSIKEVLEKYGEKIKNDAKLGLIKRNATRRLTESLIAEVHKVGETSDTGISTTTLNISANAKSDPNYYGIRFRYGNTIEHGLKRSIGGVRADAILKWINEKGITPRKSGRRRSEKTGRFLKSKTPTKKQLAKTIAYNINTSGVFKTISETGDGFLQKAINRNFKNLEARLMAVTKNSIGSIIRVLR